MNPIESLKNFVKQLFYKVFDYALWHSFTLRRPFDYERFAYAIAAKESADFFLEHMPTATNLKEKRALLQFAMDSVKISGQWLEFGVFEGADITMISKRAPGNVYGFDSFEGLPEDWTHYQKRGRFSRGGKAPTDVPDNVKIITGRFDNTLPEFLKTHTEPVAFLHIDSDLYTSAKTVLTLLNERIVPGTIIVFDDFINYPGWKRGEARAFFEFIEGTHANCAYLAFASLHHSVAVEIG